MSTQSQTMAWEFNFPLGQIQHGELSAQINAGRPELGLHDLRWNATTLPGNILGTRWSSAESSMNETATRIHDNVVQIRDAYVRSTDLVANYQPTTDFPFSSQVYWRAGTLGDLRRDFTPLQLMISLQTDLLDTRPEIEICSRLLTEEILFLPLGHSDNAEVLSSNERPMANRAMTLDQSGCLLFRLPGGRLSLAEMVHPSDFQRLELTREAEFYRSNWRLFAHFLEKGVIRRTRMVAAVVPRTDDVATATACFENFADSPLPLTA